VTKSVSPVAKSAVKRKYDNVLACFFCGKLLKMKMQRHLVSVHKDEREVAKIMSLQDQAE